MPINNGVTNQKGTPAFFTDTFANRPSFGYAGRVFISTDSGQIFEDTGTAWTLIADAGVGGGTLSSVCLNGNTTASGIVITANGLSSNSMTNTSTTAGSILFAGTSGLQSQDNTNLFWDNTNKYLGIGPTGAPTAPLDIHSSTANVLVQLNATATNNSNLAFLNANVGKWRIGNLYNAGANSFQIFDVLNSTARLTILNTGATTLNGAFTSTSLAITGGTSSQFLKADGSLDSSTYLTTGTASTTYVPYSGGTQSLTLGFNISSASTIINGDNTSNFGYLAFKQFLSGNSGLNGYTSIYAYGTTELTFQYSQSAAIERKATFSASLIPNSTTYTYNLPAGNGTLALTSDLSSYLPLAGGTLTGALSGTSATFSGQIQIGGTTNTFIDFSGSVCRFFGGASTNTFALGAGNALYYQGDASQFYPTVDNTRSLGTASFRYTTVYATTATINTSDLKDKEQIKNLTELEKNVAIKLKGLIKKFKFKDAVILKGDNARIHIGVIAQEVEKVFEDEGLNANKYGLFCSDTWYELDGLVVDKNTENAIEKTKLGIRYEELVTFIISQI